MVASTLAVLSANDTHAANNDNKPSENENVPDLVKPIKPFQLPGEPVTKARIHRDGDEDGGGGGAGDGGAGDGNVEGERAVKGNVKPVEKSAEEHKKSEDEIRDVEKPVKNNKAESQDGKNNALRKVKLNKTASSRNGNVAARNEAVKAKIENLITKVAAVKESVDFVNKEGSVISEAVPIRKEIDTKDLIREEKNTENEEGEGKKQKNGNRIKSREIKTLLESALVKRDVTHIGKNVSMKRIENAPERNNSIEKQPVVAGSDARNNV